MQLRQIAARVIGAHDAFSRAFSEAATAAVHLTVDPRNPDASAQTLCARRFVRLSLAHMAEEEEHEFPRALRSGASTELVARLYEDHRELRTEAIALDPILSAPELDDDGAIALLRFIHRFEQHVQREEWTLAAPGGC